MRFSCLPLVLSLLTFLVPQTASAATLTVRVTDPDGRGVAGARVIVSSVVGTVIERRTDTSGALAVSDLPAGGYEIRVVVSGFQADPVSLSLGAEDTRELPVALRISAISESVLVSASQIDVPLSRAADTVTVVTAADIAAHQAETVSDALQLVPGLTVTRSGGRGALTSIFPRGGNSNYTLVLVDGIRANDFGGGYDFAHLSVADVDRIEVVRGPQSALFGSDAIGSVVQIVTKRGGPLRAGGLIEGGGQGTVREAVDASGGHGAWSFGAGAEHTKSDGYTGLAADGEHVTNDDYRLSHVSGSLGYQKAGGIDFLATGNVGRDERGFPGPFGSDPGGTFSGVDTVSRGVNDTRQIGARFGHPLSGRIRQRLDANYTDLSGTFASSFGDSTNGTHRFDTRVQEDIALLPSLGASAGVEFQREQGSSSFVTDAANTLLPIRRSVTGVFGELRYSASTRLLVSGGARLEHITRDSVAANPNSFPPRPQFPDHTVNSANPKIAVSYALKQSTSPSSSSTRVRASAGTGIRPPTAFEIAFTDNPNLKPERSRSVDAGVEQQFAGGLYAVSATAFANRYEDLIVTVGSSFAGASRYKTDNISNAEARGIELTGDARITRVAVHGNYTFLSTETLSIDGLAGIAPPPFKVGDPLFRRPRHQGTIDITYAASRVSAFGDVVMRSKALDVDPSFGTFGGLFFSKGSAVLNVGASVRVARGLEVFARVMNLADRAYEEALGFPALRRQGMIGVRVAASR